LHALQLVPLAGVLLARRRRRAVERGADPDGAAARANAQTIAVGASTFGLVVVALVQALRAQPLLAPDGLTLILAVGAVLAPAGIVSAMWWPVARAPSNNARFALRGSAP
jgi:hypothetical protein